MSHFEAVKDWHLKFGVPVQEKPNLISEERQELRLSLIREELAELELAIENDNLIEIADALADLDYVICGTAVEYGIPHDACFDEVHRSNMSKIWPDGTVKYREDGRVLKPPTYSPANIEAIFEDFI